MCDSWSDHVQYLGRTDVLFDIRILKTIGHAKNRLCQRKLEISTRSSYMWVQPMSELWRFVYIASHVTLHVKPDAQKVNSQRLKDAKMKLEKRRENLFTSEHICYDWANDEVQFIDEQLKALEDMSNAITKLEHGVQNTLSLL